MLYFFSFHELQSSEPTAGYDSYERHNSLVSELVHTPKVEVVTAHDPALEGEPLRLREFGILFFLLNPKLINNFITIC